MSSIPGLERSPGGGNGKYSSLLPGKSMDRGAGGPRGCKESITTEHSHTEHVATDVALCG